MALTSTARPSPANASPVIVRVAVAAALAGAGLVHLLLASTYSRSSTLVGASFVVGGVVALAAGVWLLVRDSDMAWDVGAAVCAGMLLGLALSATTGLLGIRTTELTAPHIVAIVTEASVVAAWAATRLRRP